ncbi:hypothetical protein BCON_0397g00070 [Botryotinia convoluta]|uniref:Uncharacterized protein n=1 Tax=Botryotinia convoluta TaxID=54673 RepID=A0A4Z1HKB2_9HELO|nr:hypothetical protein BCON_0397g00070 [Botryotinia convoluta]
MATAERVGEFASGIEISAPCLDILTRDSGEELTDNDLEEITGEGTLIDGGGGNIDRDPLEEEEEDWVTLEGPENNGTGGLDGPAIDEPLIKVLPLVIALDEPGSFGTSRPSILDEPELFQNRAEGFPHLEFPPTLTLTPFVPSLFRDQQMRRLLTFSQFWQEVEFNDISPMEKSVSAQPSELDWILKSRFERGGSALHLASEKAVKLLVEKFHLSVDNQDDNGCTPLYWTSATDETGLAKALVKAGANVNLANFSKSSPLHNAVESDRSKMVRFLLGCANININAVDGHTRTPLNRAVQLQLVTITKILLAQENLAIDVKDDKGKTALDYA